jgi:hypothetical protein
MFQGVRFSGTDSFDISGEPAEKYNDMEKTRKNTITAIALMRASLLAAMLTASAAGTAQEPPARYVSELKTQVKDNLVKLTWRDAAFPDGEYRVYRSEQQITEQSFESAEPVGSAAHGAGYFVDTLEKAGAYHYAVLIEADGTEHRIFVPRRNVTAEPVEVRVLSPEELAVRITSISAAVRGDSIVVSFTPSRSDRDVVVFRSTAPVSAAGDLSNAIDLGSIESAARMYQDFPIPGITYYYAVLDRGLLESDAPVVIPGLNATVSGVSLPAPAARAEFGGDLERPTRSALLPTLKIPEGLFGQDGSAVRIAPAPETALSPAAARAEEALLARIDRVWTEPAFEPEIFVEDITPGSSADERSLSEVVSYALMRRDFSTAELLLTSFLSVRRPQEIERRAIFYLGQSLFFQGKYDRAVMVLLPIRETFRPAGRWIERALLASYE